MSLNTLTQEVSVGKLVLISAESATTKFAGAVVNGRAAELAVYIEWSHGTSAGAVQVESAPNIDYAGTWAPLGDPIAWAAEDNCDILQISGVVGAIRARISTTVTGGTVTVTLVSGHASTGRS